MSSCQVTGRENIAVMWKTVSEDCNLACSYCYYSSVKGELGTGIRRVEKGILDKFIREYMEICNGAAVFTWQGGEPLLAGLDFFEEVVALQVKYARPDTTISNSVQTNGTLVTDRFAAFFKKYNFLLGVSIDGPRELHDRRRIDSSGQGSFGRVMKGIDCLRSHQVDFNILSVINSDNVRHGKALMEFYRNEGFTYVQFIPCMKFRSQNVHTAPEFEITPQEYGDFLCETFDLWYADGNPSISMRFFDNLLAVYANRKAEMCTHRKTCPKTIILESNGDAYPCDFYFHEDWKAGNVATHTIPEILSHTRYDDFLKMKPDLPEKCKTCEWLQRCYGGCPRNRMQVSDEVFPDYFCLSYKQIYAYAHERLQKLGDKLRKQWFDYGLRMQYGGKLPGRNEACPCGSEQKFKLCCGRSL